jgi:hypothetical protein
MSERLDLYASIHKGLRNAMQASLLRLGQLDPSDAADVSDALAQLRDTLAWMENHLEIENGIIHPAIEARRTATTVARIQDDHEDHKRAFDALNAAADALEHAATEGREVQRARARHLYLSWTQFVADNYLHMAVEETDMNALLWELFTDAELGQILATILAGESPAQLQRAVRYMLPAIDPEHRARLVGDVRRSVPPSVFAQLLGGMQTSLNARDYAKLTAALESPAVTAA